MKNFNYLVLFSLMMIISGYTSAQTFWGMTSYDNTYGGGTIFSFNAQTNTLQNEYVFKPNPVFGAMNVFEESPKVYLGVCARSLANGIFADPMNNYLYRYDQMKDSSEIIFEFPGYFTHPQYHNGEADIIYFHQSVIGMMITDINEDSLYLIKYSVSDVSGRLLFSASAQVSRYVIMDFSGFKPGVYFVKLDAGKRSYSKSIIRK